jgi:hypothetical protein
MKVNKAIQEQNHSGKSDIGEKQGLIFKRSALSSFPATLLKGKTVEIYLSIY